MSERETPETDAVDSGIFYCIPMTDHARRMERERDHLRASLEQQANQIMAKASKVAEEAIRQRDELADALRALTGLVSEWPSRPRSIRLVCDEGIALLARYDGGKG